MMKIKGIALVGLCGSVVALSGCSTSSLENAFANSEVTKTTTVKYKPTHTRSVKLYYDNQKPKHKYKMIGRVVAQTHNAIGAPISNTDIQKALKTNAASIGGNAVISIHRNVSTVTGNIIRFVK